METKLGHISQAPVTTGVPATWSGHERFVGKHEQRLARLVGLTQFGVNLVTLEPGSQSALRHWHEAEDEFIYVLEGELTLVDDNGEHRLRAGRSQASRLASPMRITCSTARWRTPSFIVFGSRMPGVETIHYPDDGIGPVKK